MYVLEDGEAGKPTIVLLHGGGVGGWSWRPVVERLRSDYRLLVPDLPEQGRSLDDVPFTIPRAASLVADLIRDRVNGKAHVAGLSLGAQTLVQLLADHPDAVDRALVSGCLVRPLPGSSSISVLGAMYLPFRNIPSMVRANMRSLDVPDEYYEEFAEDTRNLTRERFAHVMTANARFRVPAGLETTSAQVLVTVGERELGVMLKSARDLGSALPSAEVRLVKGVSHNWPLRAADLFAQTLTSWIEGLPLPDALTPLP